MAVVIRFKEDGEVEMKDGGGKISPVLKFTRPEWDAFIDGVRNGEFDRFGKEEVVSDI
jgi:Domain of unknown function (DUF397)